MGSKEFSKSPDKEKRLSLRFDIHLHTSRHSQCSHIDADQLIPRAVRAGLDGIVITEHHYQWSEAEVSELVHKARCPGFIVLAGFEYTSARGDVLVYGLAPEHAAGFKPMMEPEQFVANVQTLGAACIAAHPTRNGMGFDERIAQLPVQALEVQSVNLQPHEQRMAANLAASLKKPVIAASDAHRIDDVGRYSIEVEAVIRNMADLQLALKHGKFRISGKV